MDQVPRVTVGEFVWFSLWTVFAGLLVGGFAAFGCHQDSGVEYPDACLVGSKPGWLALVVAPTVVLLGVVAGTGGGYRAVRLATILLVGAQFVALALFMLLWA